MIALHRRPSPDRHGAGRGVPPAMALSALVAIVLSAASADSAAAQTAYDRSPERVLVYREVSDQTIQITAADGTSDLERHRDGTIELTFPTPDRARAAYRALSLQFVGAESPDEPATRAVLGLPFTLSFSAAGYGETLETPEFPPEFDDLPDLARQFDDFFLPLPDEPLAVGVAWTDTASVTQIEERDELRRRTIRRLEVTADTVVGGTPAWLVTSNAQIENSSRSFVEDFSADAITTLAGVENGWFLFSREGVMLGRERVGDLRGSLTFVLADGEQRFSQTHRYTTTIELLEGG